MTIVERRRRWPISGRRPQINDELASKKEELRELLSEIEALKEAKAWRVEAIRFLKATK